MQDAALVGELVHANERLQTLQVGEHVLEIANLRALQGREHVPTRIASVVPTLTGRLQRFRDAGGGLGAHCHDWQVLQGPEQYSHPAALLLGAALRRNSALETLKKGAIVLNLAELAGTTPCCAAASPLRLPGPSSPMHARL